jgi:hypothetical protein
MKKKFEKYLDETIILGNYPDTGGIASDDDAPPGNIVYGSRYKRKNYSNRLTTYNSIWDVDDKSNFKWDWFKNCVGMDDPDNYHPTIRGLKGIYGNLMHNVKDIEVPDAIVIKRNKLRKRLGWNPSNQLGNEPVDVIINPKDIINKIERISK